MGNQGRSHCVHIEQAGEVTGILEEWLEGVTEGGEGGYAALQRAATLAETAETPGRLPVVDPTDKLNNALF